MLDLVAPDGIDLASGGHVINDMTVGTGDNGSIIGGFCAALDLDALYTRLCQLGNVVDHAHIAGIHDICSLFVLKDGKKFAGALFLHQGILITARLRTGTAIAVASGHVIR